MLKSFKDEQDRLSYLQEEIEERSFAKPRTYIAESDKSWDAMHRTLSDGKLTWDGGSFPLNHTVLGGTILYTKSDYIMSLKTPQEVDAISSALNLFSEDEFRRRYEQIDRESYDGEVDDDDFDYTWGWFQSVRELYLRATKEQRYVLFTADQ